eukprot:TRINITY_DN5683_c0_g1_i1.p1 TRINITY_DN5683_c0_g1~~TRINITY_DN5683_c0_g1_i1.p1  ORF type:complete len:261 (-),score=40.90 TRINITY_DN5683_c0_g1_i1:47-802(-)
MEWLGHTLERISYDVDPIPVLTEAQREQVIIGLYVFVMVMGVLFVFFGHRMHGNFLSSAGSAIFFVLGWSVLSSVTNYNMYLNMFLGLLISLVGVLVFHLTFWVALWFFGAWVGFVTGTSFLNIGMFGSPFFNFLWCFSFAYLGGIVSLIWKDAEILIFTSLLGGYWIAVGFDRLMLESGFTDAVNSAVYYFIRMEYSKESFVIVPKNNWFWVLLGGSLSLALVGSIVQWRFTAVINDKVKESTEVELEEA